MRRLVFAAVLLGGCGETELAPADAPASTPDAPIDAASDGNLPPDLNACDDIHLCPMGDDCVRVPWLGGARRCARQCQHTADCGLDEVCYHDVSDPAFATLRDHCWLSYCSQPLAACSLGAEIHLDPAEQLSGTCLPIDDRGADATDGGVLGPIGQCLEAGTVGETQPCALQNRVRGGEVCMQGTVCVGGATADVGRCGRLCDPMATVDSCNPSRSCFDNSQGQTVRDPQTGQVLAQISGTWGYCRVGTRCLVTAPAAVCPAGTGCLPTNPVHPNGFCATGGDGLRTVGESCVPFGDVAPALDERCREAYCDPAGADAALSGICRAFCDGTHTCQAGSCVPYTWDEASANLTQGFGVCK
jgi:hypothetical protein